MFYSASTSGFYSNDIHGARRITITDPDWIRPLVQMPDPSRGEGEALLIDVLDMLAAAPCIEIDNPDCRIPADAVEISDDIHQALLEAQSAGQVITVHDDGYPVAQDRPAPTNTDLAATRRRQILGDLGKIDAASVRPSRVIALAVATGQAVSESDVARIIDLETTAIALRAELASLQEAV